MALRRLTLSAVSVVALSLAASPAFAPTPTAASRPGVTTRPAAAVKVVTVIADPDRASSTGWVVDAVSHKRKKHKKKHRKHAHHKKHHATQSRPADSASDWKPMFAGARWNPCTVINFKVNPAGAPSNAVSLVTEAFNRVSAASGLRFVYAGTTDQVPFSDGAQDEDNTIQVAWTTPATVPGLSGSTIGLGGASFTETNVNGQTVRRYFSGGVSLDATYTGLANKYGPGSTLGNLLLHEVGHTIGLAHASSKAQEMYPALGSDAPSGYGLGDQTGLHALGASQGCVPVA